MAGATIGAAIALGLFLFWWGLQPVSEASRGRRAKPSKQRFTRTEIVLGSFGLGIGLLLALFQGYVVMLVILPVAFVMIPRMLTAPVGEPPERMEAMAQWVRGLANMTAANATLNQALVKASRDAGDAIAPECNKLADRLTMGWSTTRALYQLGEDLGSASSDNVILALIAAAEGSDAGLTASLASIDLETMREVQARRAIQIERKKAFRTARTVTIVFTLLLCFVVASPLGALYRQPMGQPFLLGLLALYAVVLLDLRRTATPSQTRRILELPEEVSAL